MARETRKYLLDRFQFHLETEYVAYCGRHQMEPTSTGLATFMIDRGLVPERALMYFVVGQEMAAVYPEKAATKTQAVEIVSHRFNISQRTVWNILKMKSEFKSS